MTHSHGQSSHSGRPGGRSKTSGFLGLALALGSIALLAWMTALLDASPLPTLRQYSLVPLAVAGVLLIIAGSYVLELTVPAGDRQDRIRVRLGLIAHSLASAALLGALFAVPDARYGLAVVLLLEIAQSARYLLIVRRDRWDRSTPDD